MGKINPWEHSGKTTSKLLCTITISGFVFTMPSNLCLSSSEGICSCYLSFTRHRINELWTCSVWAIDRSQAESFCYRAVKIILHWSRCINPMAGDICRIIRQWWKSYVVETLSRGASLWKVALAAAQFAAHCIISQLKIKVVCCGMEGKLPDQW